LDTPESLDEEPRSFLASRSVADVNPLASRSVGIMQARGPYKRVDVDPSMFWPYFEIDYHIRLLAKPSS